MPERTLEQIIMEDKKLRRFIELNLSFFTKLSIIENADLEGKLYLRDLKFLTDNLKLTLLIQPKE